MKNLAILGSTGSIGRQTLELVSDYKEEFSVNLLTCNRNISMLAKQIREFKPEYAVVCDRDAFENISKENLGAKVLFGEKGILQALDSIEADVAVNAMVGISGMIPTMHSIGLGADIALANKETLVTAGKLIISDAEKAGVDIFPVDSEHSAIYQCLNGEKKDSIKNLVLTASGGPFRGMSKNQLENVTVEDALDHPNWRMGNKITIDSATMMNKGFEVMEAKWLFGVDFDKIKVVVHHQSIVHSMVEFTDGSVIAQMSNPDMKLPIGYALFNGTRMPLGISPLNLSEIGTLTFEDPDTEVFPCLEYAYEAGRIGGTYPVVLNAANEVLVEAFLKGRIGFTDIQKNIGAVLEEHRPIGNLDYESIIETDLMTRRIVIEKLRNR